MKTVNLSLATALLLCTLLLPELVAQNAVLQGWGAFWGGTIVPPGLSNNVIAISAGQEFSLAVRDDGVVLGWGNDDLGQSSPPPGLSGVVAVSAGAGISLALKSNGTVVAWGNGLQGQTNVPSGLSGVIAISAGGGHHLALTSGGTVVAWGLDYAGQCDVPVDLNDAIAIAAGHNFSVAVRQDGSVAAWGYNGNGAISGATAATNVIAVSAGSHVLALKADGTVLAWGDDEYGQATVPPGLSNVVAVSAGGTHSVALKADGTVVAWGHNGHGQSTVPYGLAGVAKIEAGALNNLALVTPDPIIRGWGHFLGGDHVPPGLSNNVLAVACGLNFNLALRTNGTVAGWGHNEIGQASPPPGLSGVVAIAAGMHRHALALKSDGTVVAWGENFNGEASVPAGLQGVIAIDANGGAGGGGHSLALQADGSVIAWGHNGYQQCSVPADLNDAVAIAAGRDCSVAARSNGTVVVWGYSDATRPVKSVPIFATNVVAVSASDHVLALRSDGTVVGWGRNDYGQANVPAGLTDVIKVVAGTLHSIAIKSDGSAVAWGRNDDGQGSIPYRLWGFTAIDAGSRNNLAVASGHLSGVPQITQGPLSQGIAQGGSATFTVTAVGEELTYSWLKDGVVIPNATGNVLTITDAQLSDAGAYTAVVYNGAGSVSAAATLTVALPPTLATIAAQPKSLSRYKGGMYFFEVVPGGTPPFTYTWMKDGTPVPNGTTRLMVRNNAREADAGEYRVIVSNYAGSITSAPANLVLLGDRPPGPLVRLDGGEPPEPWDDVVAMDASRSHALVLRADGTVKGWTGLYAAGAEVAPAGLSGVIAVSAGEAFSLALKSDGTVVGWGDRSAANVPAGLNGVVAIAAGSFHSVALKEDGSLVKWGSGFAPPPVTDAVAIAAGFDATAALRRDGTIVTRSGGFGSTNNLDQHVDITWGSYLKSDGTVVGTGVPAGVSNVVEISGNMGLLADGRVARWGGGSGVLGGFSNVTAICGEGIPMVVTHWPVIVQHPTIVTAQPNSTVNFSVVAKGNGPLSYQWQLNGVDLHGETNAELVIANVDVADTGDYTVKVANTMGYVLSLPAELSLFGAPGITAQPVSQVVFTGAKVVFSVGATGADPLYYQWYQNGTAISGATSSNLVLAVTSASDAGNYSVSISNNAGHVISDTASLSLTLAHTWQPAVAGTLVGLQGPAIPPGLTNVIAAAAGYTHGLAVREDGTVAAWGQISGEAANVPEGLSNVVAVAGGLFQSLALRADGTVVGWGAGSSARVPENLFGVTAIAAGESRSMALKSDGTIQVWQPHSLANPPAKATNVIAIDGGFESFIALRQNGTVVTWGGLSNPGGMLDNNLTNIATVSVAHLYTMLLNQDGTVVGSPGLSNVVAVAAGNNFGLALRSDGTVVGVGIDVTAELSGVTAIAAGGFGLAITTNPPQPRLAMMLTSSGKIGVLSTVSVPNYVLESATQVGGFTEVPGYTNAFYATNSEAFEFKVTPDANMRIFRLRKQ